MSAPLKLAAVASGLALVGYSALHMSKTPQQEFSKKTLAAAEHTLQTPERQFAKKVPANFASFTIGGYEFKTTA